MELLCGKYKINTKQIITEQNVLKDEVLFLINSLISQE